MEVQATFAHRQAEDNKSYGEGDSESGRIINRKRDKDAPKGADFRTALISAAACAWQSQRTWIHPVNQRTLVS